MLIHKLPPLLACKSWTRPWNTEKRQSTGLHKEQKQRRWAWRKHFWSTSSVLQSAEYNTQQPHHYKRQWVSTTYVCLLLFLYIKITQQKQAFCAGKIDSSSPPSEHRERHSNSLYSILALKSWLKETGKCSLFLREKQVKEPV